MADLIRLDLIIPEADIEPITAFLFQRVTYGWEEIEHHAGAVFRVHIEDHAIVPEIEAGIHAGWPRVEILKEKVEAQEWALAWRDFFTPVEVGEKFVVIAPWMEEEHGRGPRIPIIIEPKTAFGTGHHPTTAVCLAVVDELAGKGRLNAGMRFLDLGTGSGILAIGCAKLGMTGLGLDIDPLAIENALENKAINGVDEAVEVATGSVGGPMVHEDSAGDEKFDLVVANILADPLKHLAEDIISHIRRDEEGNFAGSLILSGILTTQADDVAITYMKLGLPQPRRLEQGEWAAIIWE